MSYMFTRHLSSAPLIPLQGLSRVINSLLTYLLTYLLPMTPVAANPKLTLTRTISMVWVSIWNHDCMPDPKLTLSCCKSCSILPVLPLFNTDKTANKKHRTDRQSARMSKLQMTAWSGTGCFIAVTTWKWASND